MSSEVVVPVMRVVWWPTSSRKKTARHLTSDGLTTLCRRPLPPQARLGEADPTWFLNSDCYNCAHNCDTYYRALGYITPRDGKDFPPRRYCPHQQEPRLCVKCTPASAQNWPCPKGCTNPADHDPLSRYTKCTVQPPRNEVGEDGRCVGPCETVEDAVHRANPGFAYDLADSAAMYCYHCHEKVEGFWE